MLADTNPDDAKGWIKIWRKLDANTTLQEADTRGVFLTLLLRATTKPTYMPMDTIDGGPNG